MSTIKILKIANSGGPWSIGPDARKNYESQYKKKFPNN